MNETRRNQLPPIIVDYVEKLSNRNTSTFIRESYCASLERIREACDLAITKYNKEKAISELARK